MYFVTFTVCRWYYVFDRFDRWDILSQSLQYCKKNKSLSLIAFVFMLNHIHLIIESPNVIEFLRDFKKFTSKELKKNIVETEPHLLKLFRDINGEYYFWQKTNMSKWIVSREFFEQKLEYIHDNPIKKGYVMRQEDWYWSSANQYCELKSDKGYW